MDRSDFASKFPGKLVETVIPLRGRNRAILAYSPDPLPPEYRPSAEVRKLNEQALLALGELRAIIPALPNPKLISEPFVRREAVLSSKIEGTRTQMRELVLFETEESVHGQSQESSPENRDAREVSNYLAAMKLGLELIKTLPVCNRVIKQIHERLLRGLSDERGRTKSPGEFRKELIFIGNAEIETARYVGPPANQLESLMADLENYLNSPDPPFESLIQIALIHYQFETIHPFEDGNGRVGRLLITLLLCVNELLSEPLLYLSAYFERHRQEYNLGMFRVSSLGAWEAWIAFFLQGIIEEARDAAQRARNLLALRESYRTQIQAESRSGNLLRLVDSLFEFPAISTNLAQFKLGMTYQGASKNIQKLVEKGILEAVSGRERNRIFLAKEIIALSS